MRVLHLTPEMPYKRGGGGGRANQYLLCRRLVQRGHAVLNISPTLAEDLAHADDLREAGVENWTVRRPASPRQEVATAVRSDPGVLAAVPTLPVRALEMRVFWSRLRLLVERAVTQWRPDIVVVCHEMAADWARQISRDIPAVLVLHDLVWNHYLSRAGRASAVAAAPLHLEAARLRRHLVRALPRYAAATTVSTLESTELRSLVRTPVTELTIGTEVRELPVVPEPDGPPRVLFTGSLGYEPNRTGILWFCDSVWPTVHSRLPDARLEIVGRDPPQSVRALDAEPGVTVVGPVPAMEPYFERSHLVVAPILTGAGVRVKIIEAMAQRRAVVSTTQGWEGLPHVVAGKHLVAADTPDAFADATVELLTDDARRRRIAADGRALAEAHYDWRPLGDELEALLLGVLADATSDGLRESP